MKDNLIMHVLGAVMIIYALTAAVIILIFVCVIKTMLFIVTTPIRIWAYLKGNKK